MKNSVGRRFDSKKHIIFQRSTYSTGTYIYIYILFFELVKQHMVGTDIARNFGKYMVPSFGVKSTLNFSPCFMVRSCRFIDHCHYGRLALLSSFPDWESKKCSLNRLLLYKTNKLLQSHVQTYLCSFKTLSNFMFETKSPWTRIKSVLIKP